ncbi:hypothetical protein V6N13_092924 [Hibiscus sabdariffa]
MVGVKYKVTDIIPYRRILKLTRIDTLEDGLCQFHSPLRDPVVDFDLFDLAPPPPPAINYINITLAFDCLQPTIPSPQIISQYPCSSTIYNNISIIINATVLHGCVGNVTFPVVETNLLHSHNDSFSLASILSTIMEEGFQVKWKENTEACRKCNASGGACGFDSFGRPLCYCPQYQSHDECGHRDHVRSKGKLKENAVIISISVIVTGGIALLAFWFYVRKINVREAGVHENRDTIFHVMDFATIAFATNNFSSNNKLGQGGFGPVYKAWRLLKQNKTFEFIDTALGNSYDSAQVIRCYKIALLCVQDNPRDRPYMSEVVFLLHNGSELPEPNMPRYLGRTTSRISTSRNGPISICEPTSMTIYGR